MDTAELGLVAVTPGTEIEPLITTLELAPTNCLELEQDPGAETRDRGIDTGVVKEDTVPQVKVNRNTEALVADDELQHLQAAAPLALRDQNIPACNRLSTCGCPRASGSRAECGVSQTHRALYPRLKRVAPRLLRAVPVGASA